MLQKETCPRSTSHINLTGTLACKSDLRGTWSPSFSVYLSLYLCAVHRNTNDSQTAKAVRTDQDVLSEMLERVEAFFRRLDVYTQVEPDQGMVDTITAIMVEVLDFIGIATQEMKQGRTSRHFVYK